MIGLHPSKTNMTMEKQPKEDVMDPIKHGDVPASHVTFQGCTYLVVVFGDCFSGGTWVAPIWVNPSKLDLEMLVGGVSFLVGRSLIRGTLHRKGANLLRIPAGLLVWGKPAGKSVLWTQGVS